MTAGVLTIDSLSMIVPLIARNGVRLDSTYKNHGLDRLYHGFVGAVCGCVGCPDSAIVPPCVNIKTWLQENLNN